MHRFLPIVVLVIVIIFSALNLNLVKEAYHSGNLKAFVAYKFGIDGDETSSCCTETEVTSSSGDFDEAASLAIFNGEIIDYPKTSLAHQMQEPGSETQVLGTTNAAGEERWIEVS